MEDRPPQEQSLVARARRGDVGAYEELVKMHQTIAFRTAYAVTRSAADAEEAAQEAFAKAHGALWRFRPGAPFRPWLLRIVANEARNRVAAAGRREQLALRAGGERRQEDAVPSPEAALLSGFSRSSRTTVGSNAASAATSAAGESRTRAGRRRRRSPQ